MTTQNALPDDLQAKFLALTCALSPENLHCDGEITRAEADRKYRRLMREWKALEKEAGRPVTEDEVWRQESSRYPSGRWWA